MMDLVEDSGEFREEGKIPLDAIKIYWRGREFEIPARWIKADDAFRFDPLTRTVSVNLFADGVEVVPRART